MKKKLLGLGICALALGAVAGAVSAQRALEVKADKPTVVYVAFGAESKWKEWNISASATKVYFWHGTSDNDNTWPGGDVTDYIIDGSHYFRIEVPASATKMIVTADWAHYPSDSNKTEDLELQDGKNLFTVTSAETSAPQTGEWSVLDTTGERAYDPDETKHEFKVVGSSAALGSWSSKDGVAMSAAGVDGYLFKKEGLTLTAGDELKVVDRDDNAWYGANAFYASDATRANLRGVDDGNSGLNLKAIADGTFNIYIRTDHKLTITMGEEKLSDAKAEVPAADGWYLLGLDTWRPIYGTKAAAEKENEGNLAEFHSVTLTKDAEFKVVSVVDGAGSVWVGDTDGVLYEGNRYQANDPRGLFEAADDGNGGKNFKVLVSGTYSIYLYEVESVKHVSIVDKGHTDTKAVQRFVADVITPYVSDSDAAIEDDDERSAKCLEKYNRAKAALANLTSDQVTLWNSSAFAEPRGYFETWATVASGIGAMNVTNMNNQNNSALIITLVAIGAVAIAGASIYFATRKRKNR